MFLWNINFFHVLKLIKIYTWTFKYDSFYAIYFTLPKRTPPIDTDPHQDHLILSVLHGMHPEYSICLLTILYKMWSSIWKFVCLELASNSWSDLWLLQFWIFPNNSFYLLTVINLTLSIVKICLKSFLIKWKYHRLFHLMTTVLISSFVLIDRIYGIW